MTVPARLNGYPVIHSEPVGDGAFAVLCYREADPNFPFVVATWLPHLGTGWVHGNYRGTLCAAMALMPEPADELDEDEPREPYDDSGYRADMIAAGRGHLLGN